MHTQQETIFAQEFGITFKQIILRSPGVVSSYYEVINRDGKRFQTALYTSAQIYYNDLILAIKQEKDQKLKDIDQAFREIGFEHTVSSDSL